MRERREGKGLQRFPRLIEKAKPERGNRDDSRDGRRDPRSVEPDVTEVMDDLSPQG